MKILSFDVIDSTSRYVGRALDSGAEAAPFAVLARTQTHGRGRSGKGWESPRGGLYLTLAIPPEQHPHPSQPGNLSLWVAAQTAAWIEASFGLRVTIKWPNDLLFAGRKLAGILCESRFHGNVWGPALLGIGINLNEAPDVEEQESVSLDGLLGADSGRDAFALGQELCRYLESHLRDHQWRSTFDRYALEAGQLWKADSGDYRELRELNGEGNLSLSPVGQSQAESISSVSHGYRWIYQLKESAPLLVADIGNSLCKLAYYPSARKSPAQILRLDLRDPEHSATLAAFLEGVNAPRPWVVHGIAVASRPRDQLDERLRSHGFHLIALPKRPLRVDYSQYHFAQLGIDRVALAEAARHQHRNASVLVVSAGTCITIEALSKRGRYLGGYILPGLQTKLNSLHLRTDRLPLLKIYEEGLETPLPLFGTNTKSAMLSGIIHESVALLQYLTREMTARDEAPKVLITGGDGEILQRFVPGELRSDLVLEGVRLMALGGQI